MQAEVTLAFEVGKPEEGLSKKVGKNWPHAGGHKEECLSYISKW